MLFLVRCFVSTCCLVDDDWWYDTVAGLGFEAARQLGLKDTTKKVILACRNLEKANKAKQQLEELTGNKNIYNVLILDVGNLDSCRNAAKELEGTVDGIILVSFVHMSYRV